MLKQLGYIFSKKDKVKIFFLLIMVIMGAFFELMGVAIFMPFIEIVMDPGSIQRTPLLKWSYDLLGFSSVETFLTAIAGSIIFIYITKNILWHGKKIPSINFPTVPKGTFPRGC